MGLLMKVKSCLANLTLYEEVTFLVDEEKAVQVDYFTLAKHLILFPAAFSHRKWLLVADTDVQFFW